MRKIITVLAVVTLMLATFQGIAVAKDQKLEADMIALERSYIPPLFLTSKMSIPGSVGAMKILKRQWASFHSKYRDYRPNEANWNLYLEQIDAAIEDADDIVNASMASMNPAILPEAHEKLEAVRMTMLQLRPHNGFPHFITDKLTIFHDPMEELVLSVKGKTPQDIDAALIEDLELLCKEAIKDFETIKKTSFDPSEWSLSLLQVSAYYTYLDNEEKALAALQSALESRDAMAIIARGVAIKPNFVEAYKTFGDFSPFVQ